MRGWETISHHLSVAPSVSLALGSVAGIGAARVTTSHYSVIVKDTPQMMIAGPALVDYAMPGPHYDKNELGGSHVHVTNGAIDDEAASEDEAFAMARRFLSYLPSSVDELPPRGQPAPTIPPAATTTWCRSCPATRATSTRCDRSSSRSSTASDGTSSFFEIGRQWGKSIISRPGPPRRLAGRAVRRGPLRLRRRLDGGGSQKVTRVIDLASTFHLPLVHLVDCPGFLIGLQSEQEATIRHGSRALAASGRVRRPVLRRRGPQGVRCGRRGQHKAGRSTTATPGRRATGARCRSRAASRWPTRPSWPTSRRCLRPEVDKIRERLNNYRSPFRSAEVFDIEEIIDPRDTRPMLCRWANLVAPTRAAGRVSWSFRP